MSSAPARYQTWVFDCDGVLIDSNEVKTQAFVLAVQRYGAAAGAELAAFHRQHGGLSRYKKLEHFFRHILGRQDDVAAELEEALAAFSRYSLAGLKDCAVTPGTRALLESLPPGTRKVVVSGGKQDEVRLVLQEKELAPLFDGIYGSPDSKDAVIRRLEAAGELPRPAVFVGDALLDYEVAVQRGLDFVFMHGYTNLPAWQEFFAGKPVKLVRTLAELTPG